MCDFCHRLHDHGIPLFSFLSELALRNRSLQDNAILKVVQFPASQRNRIRELMHLPHHNVYVALTAFNYSDIELKVSACLLSFACGRPLTALCSC